MKKLFILVLVLLMGIMGTASASKSRFKDPNYSFSNIMNVYLEKQIQRSQLQFQQHHECISGGMYLCSQSKPAA